jgi:hypothetical protein
MPQRGASNKRMIDRIAAAALPARDNSIPSQRSSWWWVFLAPGKVILWLEYMWPGSVTGAFGGARRRNVPLIQILYSIYFYLALVVGMVIFLFYISQ